MPSHHLPRTSTPKDLKEDLTDDLNNTFNEILTDKFNNALNTSFNKGLDNVFGNCTLNCDLSNSLKEELANVVNNTFKEDLKNVLLGNNCTYNRNYDCNVLNSSLNGGLNNTLNGDLNNTLNDLHGNVLEAGSNTHTSLLTLSSLVPTLVVVPLVVGMAVMANLLVLVSYWVDPRLRTVSNLYLLQLALCDLLLAVVSMPFHLLYTSANFHWPLGKAFCKVYLMNDYTLCAMSVYLVILISWDMLLILRQGAHYGSNTTRTKAYFKIITAWTLAFLLYSPAILGWDHWRGHSILDNHECDVEFHDDEIYTFLTVGLEFILPSVSLTVLNLAVYKEIRKRTKVSVTAMTHLSQRTAINVVGEHEQNPDAETVLPDQGRDMTNSFVKSKVSSSASMVHSPRERDVNQTKWDDVKRSQHHQDSELCTGISNSPDVSLGTNNSAVKFQDPEEPTGRISRKSLKPTSTFSKPSLNQDMPSSSPTTFFRSPFRCFMTTKSGKNELKSSPKLTKKVRSDLKAARALFIFMFAFLILWAPFTIATTIVAFCEDCVNNDALEVFTWLLWTKSAVNPFLYAAGNARFKTNFVKILGKVCFCFHKKMRNLRL